MLNTAIFLKKQLKYILQEQKFHRRTISKCDSTEQRNVQLV